MRKFVCCLISGAMIVTSAPTAALAQGTAPGMRDLLGMRGSSLDNEMSRRGYGFARNVGAASMYWNGSQNRCVSALVDNGRVASIESANTSDCGKSSSSKDNTGAAVAGAAIVIGLAALLASRNKDKDRHNDAQYSALYDRGYDDGLRGRRFQRGQSDSYRQGYLVGEKHRGVPHRDHSDVYVPGGPRHVQDACKRRADTYFGAVSGVSRPVEVFAYGQGNFTVTTSTHQQLAVCSVNARGYVNDFHPKG